MEYTASQVGDGMWTGVALTRLLLTSMIRLFLVEGIITCTIGIASFFKMPSSAVATKTWFRPNGWFTKREEAIVVNRVLRDDPSKGDMHNRMAITPSRLWKALSDYDMWPVSWLDLLSNRHELTLLQIYLIGLIVYIPMDPVSSYLTISLRQLGFSTVSQPST